ncbi:DUF6680 family protein [Flavobacterium soyangense]|uniref:DUF6680 domain-containing protein n=1 Tax=Flavobacterium soyangense TaxID=2023265 RepID=A0A930UGK0_9FLAO|nr:DUF6680 family protein [Flavobacterium soyangense]MBF2710095.1 hypothetical protein [Flavobacterium soyangense]
MANTTEVVMTTKDYFEIAFWIVSLLILVVTALAVYFSPLKAVQIGRKLNDEQIQLKAKSDLFLTLFSLRGNPTAYTFVNALNQIDIVFQDELAVLTAWDKLYDSMNNKNLTNPNEIWNLLRTDLLSEMAISLGYKKLKQTAIQKSYTPIAHENDSIENWNHQQAEKQFFETGTKMHNIWIENYLASQQTRTDEIEKV